MDFAFSPEQELLRSEVRKLLDQACPIAEVRKLAETPEGFSRPLWRRIAELGWAGLALPEEHGGAGLGWLDLVVVLEETGRTLFPSPLVSCALAATAIARAGDATQRAQWLPALASGAQLAALALPEAEVLDEPAAWPVAAEPAGTGLALRGEARLVPDAQAADRFVVACRAPEGPVLVVLERGAAGLEVRPHALLDATRRAGSLVLDGARAPREARLGAPGAATRAEIARLFDCGALAATAEAAGAAEAALALAVAHAKGRVQFGQPIGRFQGVKHPLAEMLVDVESLKSLLYYAAWLLDRDAPGRALAVSRAKALAAEAFARIAIECVQLHGAIGYTWEHDAQLYLKRAKWTRPAFGDAGFHLERVARLGGL